MTDALAALVMRTILLLSLCLSVSLSLCLSVSLSLCLSVFLAFSLSLFSLFSFLFSLFSFLFSLFSLLILFLARKRCYCSTDVNFLASFYLHTKQELQALQKEPNLKDLKAFLILGNKTDLPVLVQSFLAVLLVVTNWFFFFFLVAVVGFDEGSVDSRAWPDTNRLRTRQKTGGKINWLQKWPCCFGEEALLCVHWLTCSSGLSYLGVLLFPGGRHRLRGGV